jgi:hypothetical protein
MIELREALLANREDVALALEHAEAELTACQERCSELVDLIERARLVLGLATHHPPGRRDLTLHAAIATILQDQGAAMTAPAIAREINRRSLYRRRDGRPVDAGQVHARVGSYGSLFARRDHRIALQEGASA